MKGTKNMKGSVDGSPSSFPGWLRGGIRQLLNTEATEATETHG